MSPSKPRPIWPSDDQLRERERDRVFSDDGRKLQDDERVGGMAPDADPEPTVRTPAVRPRR